MSILLTMPSAEHTLVAFTHKAPQIIHEAIQELACFLYVMYFSKVVVSQLQGLLLGCPH